MAPNTEGGPKKEKPKHIRNALGSFLALFALAEVTKVGTTRIDLREAYAETLAEAREDYEEHLATCEREGTTCSSFELFLSDHNIPDPEAMEALHHLIEEFKYPVRFYSGTTLLQKMGTFLGRYSSVGGMYGVGFGVQISGHEVYLVRNNDERGMEQRITLEDVQTVIAELSHAYNVERGSETLPYIRSLLHTFSFEGYRGAYADPSTNEFHTHQVVEHEITERFRDLQDTMRVLYGLEIDDYARSYAGTTLEELQSEDRETAYHAYEQLLRSLEEHTNHDDPSFTTESIMKLLERIPHFSARMETREDKKLHIHLIPSEAHFDSLRLLLRPHTPTGESITETVSLIEDREARQLLHDYREYRAARDLFESHGRDFPFLIAMLFGGIRDDQEFTYELYERMMQELQRSYDRLSRTSYQDADPITDHQIMLLRFVNDISTYDPNVRGTYGVFPAPRGRRDGMYQPPTVVMGQEHYEALRRYYERARFPEESREGQPNPQGR